MRSQMKILGTVTEEAKSAIIDRLAYDAKKVDTNEDTNVKPVKKNRVTKALLSNDMVRLRRISSRPRLFPTSCVTFRFHKSSDKHWIIRLTH